MSGMTKSERLTEMKRLYVQRAYTDMEMAERLGVDRTTVYRDRVELTSEYPIELDAEGRYRIDRSKLISEIKVNLHEALALYLAARKASRQTRYHQPHAASALEKLAATLRQPMTEHLLRGADQLLMQEKDPERIKIIEILTQAWVEQKKVRIRYQRLGSQDFVNHTISPYLIEPSIWSDSVYVIALSDVTEKLIAFRVDRINTAVLSGEEFEIPADFDDQELLKHAWGIWYGDKPPVTVKLRFSSDVVRRVKESVWHPLEKVTAAGDGGCIWSAEVAEWREMLPWIRGWGADCEVIEPKELRDVLMREAQELAELYKVMEKEMKNHLIAHLREKDKKPQYLWEHLSEVSDLAGQFANKIGLKEVGEILGLLHDLGKASKEFQDYIQSATGLKNPDSDDYVDAKAKKGKVDHSSAGAQVIYENFLSKGSRGRIAAQVLALCIASHHSGLIDCLTPGGENNFQRRIEKPEGHTHKTEALANFQEISRKLDNLLSKEVEQLLFGTMDGIKESNESKETLAFKYGLLIRFLFSCLIDADRLNTADFEMPGNARFRNHGQYHPWKTLIERLDNKIKEFENKPNRNEVDELRSQVSKACLDFATRPKGIYQLTVPTGGGKTLASLRFALKHAKEHSMDRVIYVIPYTSIIDQNAEEIRKILEDKDENEKYLDRVVLEHHSNLTPEEETHRQNLLAQNWDAPIVFTTQVQFLEALFGSGTRSARRMHQLANSVIIFDEVQTIPINCVHMLNVALRFLVHSCGATAVLCTATQPPLDKIDAQYRALTIQPDQRIIQNEKELFERLNRVEVYDERKLGGWSEEEVAKLAERQLQEKGSVLIIVNTKKSARRLYQIIANKKIIGTRLCHLSTNMCPAHRLNVLDVVKEKLDKEPVICVSTQLIEAGVDIDFGSVIRYLAGLDSITQSAGRCNRHGLQKGLGNVWIVNPKEENLENLTTITIGREQAERVLADFNDDPEMFEGNRIGLEAMAAYYRYYFHERRNEMKHKVNKGSPVGRDDDLFNLLSINAISVQEHQRVKQALPDIPFQQSFQTASKAFRVIDSPTRGVVVQHGDEGKEIVADLCGAPELEKQYKLLKKAQRYSVNLFPYEFDRLAKMGAIHEAQEGTGVYYLDEQYYSKDFGWSDEPVSDMKVQIV